MNTNKVTVSSQNILLPVHKGDAGHDLVAKSDPKFVGEAVGPLFYKNLLFIEYDTGVVVEPSEHLFTIVTPRSSITANTNLALGNSVAVIDTEYRGTIKLRFRYIPQPEDLRLIDGKIFVKVNQERIYHAGDRIGQAIFLEHTPVELCLATDAIGDTTRGQGGFGSTGR